MFCRKCGCNLPEHATVCDSCNTRIKPPVFCHKCATELPANSTRCTNCNAKSRAHKRGKHWLPLLMTFIAFVFFVFGGTYQHGIPYATVADYLALIIAVAAFLISIFVIPRTRLALKIVSILFSGIMLFFSVVWILEVLLS